MSGPAPPRAEDRLFVALDVATVAEARGLIERLDGTAAAFKLGPWLLLAPGFELLIDELVAAGKPVFLDTKGCDIPETMRGGVAAAAARGIGFLTIHGNDEVTDAAMRAAVEAKGALLKLLCVTVLTSLSLDDLAKSGATSVEDVVLARAARALANGCDGVIASGREVALIRRMAGTRPFLIVAPGIRPAGADAGDQQRAVTPAMAIAAGADYLVVGRPIVRAADPAAAARSIVAEMQAAFDRA